MSTRDKDTLFEIKEAIGETAKSFEHFRDVKMKEYDKRHEELDKDLDDVVDRIEDLESRQRSPGKIGGGMNAKDVEHVKLFSNWIRKPNDVRTKEALSNFEDALQIKDVTIGTSAAGGYAVPEILHNQVERFERKMSPVRDLVNVVKIGSSDFRTLLDLGGATSGWVSETASRTATVTPTLREIVPTQGEIYAYPQASNWSVDDIFFDVSTWLTESIAEAFAVAEGIAVISGNGSSRPTGMLNTTPVTTADDASPKRAAAAYQYILGGDNSPAAVDADTLIDLAYTLNQKYRANAKWVMNSTTAAQVRKIKEATTNQYLWQPGLSGGQPDRLLGYEVVIWENMPDPNGGQFPIAFGDFKRGYMIVDRHQIRVTVDPYTTPGYTKFYVRARRGGIVNNNDAIKWLKLL